MVKKRYYNSNFIRTHIITKIFEKAFSARAIADVPHNSFIYFDDIIPIKNGDVNQNVNRFGKGGLHGKNQVIPLAWTLVSGKELYKSLMSINNRRFYILKEIEGQYYKTRIKLKVEK